MSVAILTAYPLTPAWNLHGIGDRTRANTPVPDGLSLVDPGGPR
jgi:hypothetical protein